MLTVFLLNRKSEVHLSTVLKVKDLRIEAVAVDT